MLVECPGCKKIFRAYIEEGHEYIEFKDIHGEKHKIHASTCKCAKKALLRGNADGAANNK